MHGIEKLESRNVLSAVSFSSSSSIGEIGVDDHVVVVDLDNDGDQDIVAPNKWLENRGVFGIL